MEEAGSAASNLDAAARTLKMRLAHTEHEGVVAAVYPVREAIASCLTTSGRQARELGQLTVPTRP